MLLVLDNYDSFTYNIVQYAGELGVSPDVRRNDALSVEGALAILYGSGVYLTVDELKGRRPAIRGSTSVTVRPDLLRNGGARPPAR